MFAIIETGGKQFKVAEGQKLEVEKLEVKAGGTFKIDEVLLISEKGHVTIGKPYIKGASVSGKVIAHGKEDKILVFKMKAKKRYQKTQGHRQNYTEIEITEIKASGSVKSEAPAKKEEAVEAPKEAPVKAAAKPKAKKPTAKKD